VSCTAGPSCCSCTCPGSSSCCCACSVGSAAPPGVAASCDAGGADRSSTRLATSKRQLRRSVRSSLPSTPQVCEPSSHTHFNKVVPTCTATQVPCSSCPDIPICWTQAMAALCTSSASSVPSWLRACAGTPPSPSKCCSATAGRHMSNAMATQPWRMAALSTTALGTLLCTCAHRSVIAFSDSRSGVML